MIEDEDDLDYQRELYEEKMERRKALNIIYSQFVNWRTNFPIEFDIWNGDNPNVEIVNEHSPKLEIWQTWKINRDEEDRLIKKAKAQLPIIENLIYSDAILKGFNQFLHDIHVGRLCRIIDEWKISNKEFLDEFLSVNIDNWFEYEFYSRKDDEYRMKVQRSLSHPNKERILNYNANIGDIRRLELWVSANHRLDWNDWAYRNIKSWPKYVRNGYSNMYQEVWWKKGSGISYSEWREENIRNQISYSDEFKRRLILNRLKTFHYSGGNIFNDSLTVFEQGDEYGFVDINGNIVIEIQFDDAREFHNGLAAVKVNAQEFDQDISGFDDFITLKFGGQWGFINTKGAFVIEPQYDILTAFKNGIASFCKGGSLRKFNDNYISDGGKWGIISEKGEELVSPTYDFIKLIGDGVPIANIGGKRDSIDGAFYGGSWCIMSKSGNELTPFKYTWIYNFENGKAIINVGGIRENDCYLHGLWGYIDENGSEIGILRQYHSIEDFKYHENDY